MPLYMDIHTVDSDNFSVEDVVTAHMEDLAVQQKFGVIQIKYWVDTEHKKIFCLMEGPSKEACHAVHLESHGNTACNIIEVSDDEYNLFLNIGKSKNDLAHTYAGEIDPGFRTFLYLNTIDFTNKFKHYNNQCHSIIEEFDGVNIGELDGLLVSFMDSTKAVKCAISIEKLLRSITDNYEYRIALVTGNPVDETGDKLFEETKNNLKILGRIGSNKTVCMDAQTRSVIEKQPNAPKFNGEIFKIISPGGFTLLKKVDNILKSELFNPDFNMGKLNLELGLSKAQSYRKIKSVTGLAPNQFIQELRLRNSLEVLKKNTKTVSEIAYDLGFTSPTYFTRVFRKRFKVLPSSFAKHFI